MSNSHVGSCLCKEVSFEIQGEFEKFFLCHCSRCRKETGSAHASNLFSKSAEFKWTTGENSVQVYEHPNSRFTKSFCKRCGSALPIIKKDNSLLVPAGSLDSDVDLKPNAHIQTASRANWDQNLEKIPQFEIYP